MDLTTGSPVKQILLFSLPLILGTLFQQLYSFVDTVMVGRLIGTDALASVGATYSLHFLILGFVQGTCVGFGIPLAQAFGAKEREEYQRFFWNGSFICAVMAVILTVSMTVLTDGLLNLMNTPSDILAGASVYVKIIFLGIPASILYNFCAGALRAAGDSSHPFYFLLFPFVYQSVEYDSGLSFYCSITYGSGRSGLCYGFKPAAQRSFEFVLADTKDRFVKGLR